MSAGFSVLNVFTPHLDSFSQNCTISWAPRLSSCTSCWTRTSDTSQEMLNMEMHCFQC